MSDPDKKRKAKNTPAMDDRPYEPPSWAGQHGYCSCGCNLRVKYDGAIHCMQCGRSVPVVLS